MTTPKAGEIIAVPEFRKAICAVKSTLRMNSGQPSPLNGRMPTRRCKAQAVTIATPSAIRQNALHSGGTLSTPMRMETRLPPQRMLTVVATRTPRAESRSMGAEADRKILLSRAEAQVQAVHRRRYWNETGIQQANHFFAGAPYVCPGNVTWSRIPSGSKNSFKVP